jgi:hypothetical protein
MKISTEEAAAQSGWTPSQIRKLKIAVIVMGVLLVVGFAALLIGLSHKASQLTTRTVPQSDSAPEALGAVGIGLGGKVLSVQAVDGAVVVEVERAGMREVLVLSLDGKMRSRTVFKPE